MNLHYQLKKAVPISTLGLFCSGQKKRPEEEEEEDENNNPKNDHLLPTLKIVRKSLSHSSVIGRGKCLQVIWRNNPGKGEHKNKKPKQKYTCNDPFQMGFIFSPTKKRSSLKLNGSRHCQ